MKRSILLFFSLILAISQLQAQSYVGLENGTQIEYENIILVQKAFSKKYLEADDSAKYSLDEVRYYQNHNGYFLKRVKNTGKYDFMKRELSGEIELYGITKTNSSMNPSTGMMMTSGYKMNYYRMGDGSIKKLNGKNLKIDLSGCSACIQEVKKGKTMSALSAVVFTAGVGVLLTAAISDSKSVSNPGESLDVPVGIILGPALCIGSLFFSGPKKKHFQNAVSIYNDNH